MKFRRVLVATALVAVLASSLFGGWLDHLFPVATAPRVNAQTPPSGETVQNWTQALTSSQRDFRIFVPSDQSKPRPPYITSNGGNFIPADPTTGRPEMVFELAATSFNHSRNTSDIKWLIFQAYERINNGQDWKKIDNFYFMVNDCSLRNVTASGCLKIIYDTDQTSVFQGKYRDAAFPIGPVILGNSSADGLTMPDDDINTVFGYVMDAPKDNSKDCSNDNYYKTGPPNKTGEPYPTSAGYEGKTVNDIQKKHSLDIQHPSELNPNCGSTSGWLNYWGVAINFASIDKEAPGCKLGGIVSDGIGTAVVRILACVVQKIIDSIFTPLRNVTQGAGDQTGALEANLAGTGPNKSFYDAWKFSLGLINIVVILALLAIAFANILHLNINTYTAKKALPGLVIGVAGANASLLLIRFLLDVAKALQSFAFDIASTTEQPIATTGQFVSAFMDKVGMTAFENKIINGALLVLGPLTLILVLIFAIYMFYLVIVFAWGMIKRLVYIYGLTVLAPLAFVTYGIPGQQQWFTKWWDMMLRQIFMLPIVFLGAAMLIRYMTITVVPPNDTLGPADISNLVNMTLVFLAATAILKLPGLITKGAIDITGAAKKAFGMAKVAPQSALMATSGLGKSWKDKPGLRGGIGRTIDRWDNAKHLGQFKYRGKLIKVANPLGLEALTKYSTAAGNPEIFQAGFQDRFKQAATDRKVEFNSSKAGDLPFIPANWAAQKLGLYASGTGIRGIASGRKSEVIAGIDDVNDYIARGGDIGRLIKKVMLREKKDEDGNTVIENREAWQALKDELPNLKDEDLLSLAGRTNKGDLQKLILTMVNSHGLAGHDSGWRLYGTAREIYDAVSKEVNLQTRNFNYSAAEKADMVIAGMRDAITNDGNFEVTTDPDRAKKRSQGGFVEDDDDDNGGAAYGRPGNGSGGNGGASPPNDVQDVRVVNPVTVLNPQNEAVANTIWQHAQELRSKFDSVTLANHVNDATSVADLLSGEVGEAIRGQLGSLVTAEGGEIARQIANAIASGSSLESIREKVGRGQLLEETGRGISTQAAQFSDEQLEQLGNKIGQSTGEALQEVNNMLAPHFQKLGISDTAVMNSYAQRIVNGFREVMTQGPKSVRAYWQGTMDTLTTALAREQGIEHLAPESIARAIAQTQQSQPATPASPPNVQPASPTPESQSQPPQNPPADSGNSV